MRYIRRQIDLLNLPPCLAPYSRRQRSRKLAAKCHYGNTIYLSRPQGRRWWAAIEAVWLHPADSRSRSFVRRAHFPLDPGKKEDGNFYTVIPPPPGNAILSRVYRDKGVVSEACKQGNWQIVTPRPNLTFNLLLWTGSITVIWFISIKWLIASDYRSASRFLAVNMMLRSISPEIFSDKNNYRKYAALGCREIVGDWLDNDNLIMRHYDTSMWKND